MRHSLYIAFALALAAGNTQARAEMVTYNMTGTITSAPPSDSPSPFAVGDHISWTLQYDNSTPMYTSVYAPLGGLISSNLTVPLITNIVDHTSGASIYIPSLSGSDLRLASGPPNGSSGFFEAAQYSADIPRYPEGTYSSALLLNVNGSLPTLNLANLQLNILPLNLSTSSLDYMFATDMESPLQFTASVDSISAPMRGAPEPGSLTLFLLGAAGLAVRGMHRRLGQVGSTGHGLV